jgi:hypothetical protein
MIGPYWNDTDNLILLGDVIYQGQVMNRIFEHQGRDMFFGNYAEIFAYYFSSHNFAERIMKITLDRCMNKDDIGSLHSLFRAYCGDFDSPNIERHKDTCIHFTHVTGDGGWTRDIDTPLDYKRFVEEVVSTHKLDDLP